jgi:hypothetical protein
MSAMREELCLSSYLTEAYTAGAPPADHRDSPSDGDPTADYSAEVLQ